MNAATQAPDRTGFYYVTAVRGAAYVRLAGPYVSAPTLADVLRVRQLARRVDTALDAFGTCRADDNLGLGKLHELGLLPVPSLTRSPA